MRVGYVRVSNRGPLLDAQLLAVRGCDVRRIHTDEKRHSLAQRDFVVRALRPDDTLVVYSLDRLAPNEADLLRQIDRITEKGATLVCIEPALTTADPAVAVTFAAIKKARQSWQSERGPELSPEAARRRGKRGRALRKLLDPDLIITARRNWFDPDFTVKECAGLAGVGHMTLYRRFGPRDKEQHETDEHYALRKRGKK